MYDIVRGIHIGHLQIVGSFISMITTTYLADNYYLAEKNKKTPPFVV